MDVLLKRKGCAYLILPNCSLTGNSNVFSRSFICPADWNHKPRQHPDVVKAPRRCTIVATNARGFGGFLSNSSANSKFMDSLPSPDATCACGTDKPYGKCCRRFHTAQSFPQLPEELLRSRYSAYAYRLPSYVMKTTHTSMAELDRRKWKREILNFCKEYQFVGGVDIIEEQMTGPYSTRIMFR